VLLLVYIREGRNIGCHLCGLCQLLTTSHEARVPNLPPMTCKGLPDRKRPAWTPWRGPYVYAESPGLAEPWRPARFAKPSATQGRILKPAFIFT
jgi:hypothetical protein